MRLRNLPAALILALGLMAVALGLSAFVAKPVNAIAAKIQAHNASMQIVGAE